MPGGAGTYRASKQPWSSHRRAWVYTTIIEGVWTISLSADGRGRFRAPWNAGLVGWSKVEVAVTVIPAFMWTPRKSRVVRPV